ncbi:DUF1993 domain-containing protein [Dyella tabacisoli]|uniref:DUF1993 domain-containing protein n=1 Tax=Dyella tabacisoli TaxID=2282381 RepID=A0A369UI32_9GAMM|nr:DUF1993 domain-containing protein [Dyella tabacisoli]RDD80231.1 DUF1993 domain-containing protein [Dyella tabacisoli]
MTLSMYQASVPVFLRTLSNLSHVLKKGEAHALANGISPEVMLQTRLIPDMYPLVRQVQIATDMAKNACARLAGVEPLKIEDDETSFAQLHARLERVIAYIKTFKPEQIDGSETRAIEIKSRNGNLQFEGEHYLLHYVIPNMFFHSTTAYAILRTAGAELGKADFIGKV